MFDNYKDRFRKMEQRLAYLTGMEQENLAMSQLQQLFGAGFFMPLTAWSIAPTEVLHICNDLVVNNRKGVIEFGSGYSTLCIARVLQITGSEAIFYSVESDENWLSAMQQAIDRNGLGAQVTMVYAPVTDAPEAIGLGQAPKWYDVARLEAALAGAQPFDLVVVDGPFGAVSPHARYPALPYLKDRLAPQYSIFLDDAGRSDEREIASKWEALLGCTPQDHGRYMHFTNHKGFEGQPFGHYPF